MLGLSPFSLVGGLYADSVPESGKMTSLLNWARSMNPDGKFQWKAVLKSGKETNWLTRILPGVIPARVIYVLTSF